MRARSRCNSTSTSPPPSVREERGAAVDRARKDRRENDEQDGVESGLARERTFMTEPDHNERGNKDDDPAQ